MAGGSLTPRAANAYSRGCGRAVSSPWAKKGRLRRRIVNPLADVHIETATAFPSGKAHCSAGHLDARQDGAAHFQADDCVYTRRLSDGSSDLKRRSSHGRYAQEREEESQAAGACGQEKGPGGSHRSGLGTSQRRGPAASLTGTCHLVSRCVLSRVRESPPPGRLWLPIGETPAFAPPGNDRVQLSRRSDPSCAPSAVSSLCINLVGPTYATAGFPSGPPRAR